MPATQALWSRAALWLIARLVPSAVRERWLEEWRAETAYGGRRMMLGAPIPELRFD